MSRRVNSKYPILLAFSLFSGAVYASEFNTDILDAEDLQNVDLSQFSVAGYVPPGDYILTLFTNGRRMGAPRDVTVYPQKAASEGSSVCVPADTSDLLGLTPESKEKITLSHDGNAWISLHSAVYKQKLIFRHSP